MGMLTEADVLRFRHDYYALLARLLAREPDAALLESLQESIEDRAVGAAQVHRLMGEGWRTMEEHLASGLEPVVDEFTRIFLGPTGDLLKPYESYYLTKAFYAEPLSAVRGFMKRHNLEAHENDRNEPEDNLAFELSVMLQLIHRQQAAGDADPQSFVEAQREFLASHLLIWGPACAAELAARSDAEFYRGVAQVLEGFLEVEREFFSEDGGLNVETLAEARRRYSAPVFKGPVYDAEQIAGGKTSSDTPDE